MSETDAISGEQAEHILAMVQTAGANAEILDQIERSCGDNDLAPPRGLPTCASSWTPLRVLVFPKIAW